MSSDQLDALADEIATFAARIDVAEHALITRLRLFDAHEAWGRAGARSCAEWLSWRTGIGIKAAREKVRVARALGSLPKIDALFGRGELSYSKVRALTRAATPESEQDFIDVAMHASASQLERLTRAYSRVRDDSGGPERPLSQRRFVRRAETPAGMVRIEMQLTPEEATMVWNAVMSALDGREASAEALAEAPAEAPDGGAESRRVEASAAATANKDGETLEERCADAMVDVARAYLQHRPRTLGSGYELVVITTDEQLAQGADGIGGYLPDGTPVPLQVARMLASDGARVDVVMGKDGELLDVGRRTRAIPAAIARALWLRDGGCRVPGCERRRHLHGHHVQGWADGGATRLSNLVLVCSSHHRMIHEGKLGSEVREGKIVFVDRRGRAMDAVPPSGASGRDLEELEVFLREEDVHVDASTTLSRWDGSRVALGEILDWMLIAERGRSLARAG
ncbi:MAG: DUF222 domain-containing protein [Enhygromyxa sp.]